MFAMEAKSPVDVDVVSTHEKGFPLLCNVRGITQGMTCSQQGYQRPGVTCMEIVTGIHRLKPSQKYGSSQPIISNMIEQKLQQL